MKAKDLTGMQFGGLNVIGRSKMRGKRQYWRCQCGCGNFAEVYVSNLMSGSTTSCGCRRSRLQKERITKRKLMRLNVSGNEFVDTGDALDELEQVLNK